MLTVPAQINGSETLDETAAVIGSSVDLHCHTDGVPQPTVRWVRDGQPITFVDHPNLRVDNAGQTLRVHSVQLVDIGAYTCHASNAAGNASKQFLLNILGLSVCLSVCYTSVVSSSALELGVKAIIFHYGK